MRKLTDIAEIIEVLSKYDYNMINKENNYEGEITTLNEKDIDDILWDMSKGTTIEEDDNGMIIVRYPHNVCILESRNERGDNDKMGVWNYRVMRKKRSDNNYFFEVCEVHYNNNNEPYMFGEIMSAESFDELKEDYEYILKTAFDMPVLEEEDGKLKEVI